MMSPDAGSGSGRGSDGSAGEADLPVSIEITIATEAGEHPPVEDGTRVDVSVDGEMYPTARLEDGSYVAWWFRADESAPAPDDPVTTEWVSAPTRFLAAGTLHERWEDPAAYESMLRASAIEGVPDEVPSASDR